MKYNSKYNLKSLAKDTLQKAQIPLTVEEIWEKAVEFGLAKKVNTVGKTPWRSIGAQIYVDIRDNEESIFKQTQKSPVKFTLKNITQVAPKTTEPKKKIETPFRERELHPLLSTFVSGDSHFRCYTKTIYHEKSNNEKKGQNKWLHPDIVGVYFPFNDYNEKTRDTIKETFRENAIKLYSFEIKINIDMAHLREYFFQSVSNSSWANEGYLVALKYGDDSELIDEMRRLNNAFGIGFIQLNAENVEQSEILLPARQNSALDWEMINRLIEENPDFSHFIDCINEDSKVGKVKSSYDSVFDVNEMQEYVHKHHIVEGRSND